jgi:hypothetical protein
VGRHWDGRMRLYRNLHDGRFREEFRKRFPRSERAIRDPHRCAAGDVDRDGLVDLFCATGGVRGTDPNPSVFWKQGPAGTFRQRTRAYRVADRWGRGRVATFLDANRDRWPDLFVGNTYPRDDGHRSLNRLYLNVRGQRFRRAPRFGLDRQLGAQSVQAADFDRDGRDDVVLCGKHHLHLFRNVPGRHFRDVTGSVQARGPCAAALLARLNGDRRPDLVLVRRRELSLRLFRRGRFHQAFRLRRAGGADAAVGDVNGDGRLDVYWLRRGRYNHDARDIVLVNRGRGRFHHIRVPQTRLGRGDAVEALDYDRNGLTDFAIQNGFRKARGPVRLIAFR